jgi:hypothetical protein
MYKTAKKPIFLNLKEDHQLIQGNPKTRKEVHGKTVHLRTTCHHQAELPQQGRRRSLEEASSALRSKRRQSPSRQLPSQKSPRSSTRYLRRRSRPLPHAMTLTDSRHAVPPQSQHPLACETKPRCPRQLQGLHLGCKRSRR